MRLSTTTRPEGEKKNQDLRSRRKVYLVIYTKISVIIKECAVCQGESAAFLWRWLSTYEPRPHWGRGDSVHLFWHVCRSTQQRCSRYNHDRSNSIIAASPSRCITSFFVCDVWEHPCNLSSWLREAMLFMNAQSLMPCVPIFQWGWLRLINYFLVTVKKNIGGNSSRTFFSQMS